MDQLKTNTFQERWMRSDIRFIPSSVLQEASYEEDILCSSLLCDKRWHLFLKYRKEKDVFGIVYFKTFLEFLLYANCILLKYFTPKPQYLKHLALNRLSFVCHRTGELYHYIWIYCPEMEKAASVASALVLFFPQAVLISGLRTRKTCY